MFQNNSYTLALQARVDIAPDAGMVSHLDVFDVFPNLKVRLKLLPTTDFEITTNISTISSHLDHHSGNLVSRHQWKGDRDADIVPRKVDIRVTDAAIPVIQMVNLLTSMSHIKMLHLMSMVTSSGPQVFLWIVNFDSLEPLEVAPTDSTDSISGIVRAVLFTLFFSLVHIETF